MCITIREDGEVMMLKCMYYCTHVVHMYALSPVHSPHLVLSISKFTRDSRVSSAIESSDLLF